MIDDGLQDRIDELQRDVAARQMTTAKDWQDASLVPEIQLRILERQQQDLGWLTELQQLRAITQGIIAGDHEAIARGMAAALDDELLLGVTHTLLTHLAKKA